MKDKVLKILNDARPEFDFLKSDKFIEGGYLDSFDIVSVVNDIEDVFEISIDGLDIIPENFNSLDSIITLINKSK